MDPEEARLSSPPPRLSAAVLASLAGDAGFDAAGFARPTPIPRSVLEPWLRAGYAADMDWIGKRLEDRLDPTQLFPGVRTVVALASGYWTGHGDARPSHIARYARGRDYHATIRDRLRRLRNALKAQFPNVGSYSEVDAGPVMEKVWAARAGLGFVGRHGLLITPERGSWVVLAVMMIDVEVDRYHEAPPVDACGTCRRCIEACPTDAILPGKRVDARRCLSYTTIEQEGPIPEAIREGHAGVAFGCDICQDVCPFNSRQEEALGPRFLPRPFSSLSLEELATVPEERFKALTRGSALARAGWSGMRRNALYALGAAQREEVRPLLEDLRHDPDPVIADAARWALSRLDVPK
ncbi:MAG TPA: tRNA epoxyqueuosine(34) reductase QueG [Myxococcaceae bacterium]|nr:tRNA epoxyqueuosine(34) reductase QueG [Myxococcaceae bacterium]